MCPSSLTDSQWALVAPLVSERLRPRKHSVRTILLRAHKRLPVAHAAVRLNILDSQSAKRLQASEQVGNGPFKRVRGRKRHLALDSQGSLLPVVVGPASEHEAWAAANGIRMEPGGGGI